MSLLLLATRAHPVLIVYLAALYVLALGIGLGMPGTILLGKEITRRDDPWDTICFHPLVLLF